MVKKVYTPKKCDIVWLNFEPTKGHEQSGKRPALVITDESYNKKSGLCVVLPITSKVSDYPFLIHFKGTKISGAIITDQMRSIDWKARNVEFSEKINEDIYANVAYVLDELLFG